MEKPRPTIANLTEMTCFEDCPEPSNVGGGEH